MMVKLKICELVFDSTIYPRHNIDAYHVNDIARAIQSGAEMPPIVVEKRTNRIVDGFHRGKAYFKLYDDSYEIEVVQKSYKDERLLFLDAIRFNSGHGKGLDKHDKTHCAIMAKNLGIDAKDVASALHVDPDFVGRLIVDRTAFFGKLEVDKPKVESKAAPSDQDSKRTDQESQAPKNKPFGLYVPIKQTIKHMAGKTLTDKQHKANEKLGGMNQSFYANQLITLIENRLIDKDDEKLFERLRRLHELLDSLLVT